MGLLETAGAAALLHRLWGLSLAAAIPLGFLVAQIPLLGTVGGIAGAMFAWGMTAGGAAGLFIGPYLLLLGVFLAQKRRSKTRSSVR